MANRERLVLVDGSALIFRAFFAIPPNFTTAAGLHTNAIYGFANMFRKLFAGRKPDFGAVIFDAPGATFREEKYPEYKAQRPAMADELREQLPWIDKVVEAHRFPLLRVAGYEADDVIGTLTRRAVEAGMEVLIVSGDKDFAQLVTDDVKMVDTLRDVTYDPELVFKKWGVKPENIVDLFALMGDSVDNIPGVPGIGQKGAAGLIATYGSLDRILERTAELKGRQRTALEEHKASAILSRDLATIDQHVPLDLAIADLAIPAPEPARLNALYKELEFYSLLSAEERSASAESAPKASFELCATLDAARAALEGLTGTTAVYPLFDPAKPVTGELAGVAFSTGEGHGFYIPIKAEDGGLGREALDLLKPFFEDAARPKVTFCAKELWIVLRRHDIALAGVSFDALLASFLIDPTKIIPHRIDQVAKEFLHRTLPPIKDITGSGQKEKRPCDVPMRAAGDFACTLAEAIACLHPILKDRLEAEGQTKQLLDNDLPLAWVLGQMELDGIRVDPVDIQQMGQEFRAELAQYERDIYSLAGKEFNIGSTKQLATVLFEDLKLPIIKRNKTGYSTDVEVLEKLAPKHAIVRHLLEHRRVAKLINTYTDVLEREVNRATGRIHATFQQTVGATGRLITTEPDLQRTPVRTAEGRRIRKAFIPRDGHLLISADWSQIELRLLAHFSGDALLVESFRAGADVHRRTASHLFKVPLEAVTSEQRGVGKTVNFATIYGQGATALGQILDVPRKDAEAYIEGYFQAYAGVRAWLDATIATAHEKGYVTTLLGRRRYIPELASRGAMDRTAGERIAANTPIQGSGADICKLAMLRIARRLQEAGHKTRMLLQIHDELVFEAPEDEVEPVSAIIRDSMEHVVPLAVPLVVDLGVGKSWADAH